MFRIEHIDHVALAVTNVQHSIQWYQEVLGLERRYQDAWGDCPAVLCAGHTCVALFPSERPSMKRAPAEDSAGMRHLAFRADRSNFEKAQVELRQRGIRYHFEDHGISQSIYFPDPDGYLLEITTMEKTPNPEGASRA